MTEKGEEMWGRWGGGGHTEGERELAIILFQISSLFFTFLLLSLFFWCSLV